jgi:hypothetical protein
MSLLYGPSPSVLLGASFIWAKTKNGVKKQNAISFFIVDEAREFDDLNL